MSDTLQQLPTNQVIYGGNINAGISRTGLMFGNPISSYDINSTQNNLLNLISNFFSNTSQASVDISYHNSNHTYTDSITIRNIRSTITDPDTKETYLVSCPELIINPPDNNIDQYLRLYYKIVSYVKQIPGTYSPNSNEIISTKMYNYGYRKLSVSASSNNEEEIPEEDVSQEFWNNMIDSELSTRRGIQWTLIWETSTTPSDYKQGPIVALHRRVGNYNILFNTSRRFESNTNLLNIPTLYASVLDQDYILLDGAYDLFMSNTDTTNFRVQVVFDKDFNIEDNHRVIVGVKNANLLYLEYKLLDGSIVTDNSKWVVNKWYANKPYLMYCNLDVLSYTDPSTEQYKKVKYYTITHKNHQTIINSSTSTFNALYYYNGSKFIVKPNIVYNIGGNTEDSTSGGIDHYYNGNHWRTSIPAGVEVHTPRHDKNINNGYPCSPVGTVCCGGLSLSKTTYSELYKFLGTSYNDPNNNSNFLVPDYTNRYIRSYTSNTAISSTNYNQGNDNFVLEKKNIPSMVVSEEQTIGGTLTINKTKLQSANTTDPTQNNINGVSTTTKFRLTPSASISTDNLNSMMSSMIKHYHLPGYAAYDPGSTSVNSNAPMVNTTPKAIWESGYTKYNSGRWKFASTINPTNTNYLGIPCTSNKANGKTTVTSATNTSCTNDKVYWSLTSLGISNSNKTFTSKVNVDLTNLEKDNTNLFTSTTIINDTKGHSHSGSCTVKIPKLTTGTTGDSTTPVSYKPSYSNVGTYIYLGQSLVIEEDETVTITTNSQGTVYSAPSISSELYSIT